MTCKKQFKDGVRGIVTRIRDRRFVAVDREKGIVFAFVIMITVLISACAGTPKKQAASNVDETAQVSVKDESDNSEINDDQTIVCRRKAPTGSQPKKKICKTKAQ